MRLKLSMVLCIIMMVLFISACQKDDDDEKPEIKEIKGGIDVIIEEGSLPEGVIRNKVFPLSFKLRNTGRSSASGVVTVKGTSSFLEFKDTFGTSTTKSFSFSALPGRSTLSANPPEKAYELTVRPYLDDLTESKTVNIEFMLCYTYSLVFKQSVCVDTRPNLPSGDKACTYMSQSFKGQGAPINVVSLQQRTYTEEEGYGLKRKVEFIITIRNMMEGAPIPVESALPGPNNYCQGGKLPEGVNMGYVEFGSIRLGDVTMGTRKRGVEFECSGMKLGQRKVPFVNNEAQIVCTATFDEDVQPYTSLLEVPLYFGYYSDMVVPIKIYRN